VVKLPLFIDKIIASCAQFFWHLPQPIQMTALPWLAARMHFHFAALEPSQPMFLKAPPKQLLMAFKMSQ
jgi:hypothetical protein